MGIILFYSKSIYLKNNRFENLDCPPTNELTLSNGVVSLIGKYSYKYIVNDLRATINDNTFKNCTCRQGGSLGIINYNSVYLKNNSYAKNKVSEKGGHMVIFGSF